jgi:putative DNA methylase
VTPPSSGPRKKLIEVALPLEAINKASAREKSIRHGHPSTLHLWWARRPLAAARAVIFAQMVDDPASYVDVLRGDSKLRRKAESVLKNRVKVWEEARALAAKAKGTGLVVPEPGPAPTLDDTLTEIERQRLFRIIEDLVLWENTTNETVLQAARDEIWASWRRACAENADHPRAKELFDRGKLPAFHDPFAGGGALPLEAQRLGLESYASDLNPVAVLINKAMIEIPPKFAGKQPVNQEARKDESLFAHEWKGAQGLAEDVRYYGQWMRDEAEKRIGHLYPKIEVTADMAKERPDLKPYVGRSLTVIAWLWARTVKSPNPAFAQVDVPLAASFMLSTKAGKEAYIEPVIDDTGYHFAVKVGTPKNLEAAEHGTKLAHGANFRCLLSGAPIAGEYIKAEGRAGRIGARLMAIVADGDGGRLYLSPTLQQEAAAFDVKAAWRPEVAISGTTQYLGVKPYGMDRFDQLFTNRQLATLATLSDLVQETREKVRRDAIAAGLPEDGKSLMAGGTGPAAYAEAVSVYLSFVVDKETVFLVTQARWRAGEGKSAPAFGRQAIAMVWDYADLNPFAGAGGDLAGIVQAFRKTLENGPARGGGLAEQSNAATQTLSRLKVLSTDPPYYDNVPYADLSDYFYVWLRRSLKGTFPELFSTVVVPKAEELVAFAYRHDGKAGAEAFFLDGMTRAIHQLAEQGHPAFPVTIYYAFKQSESDSEEGTASTGWETFLDAVIRAGFSTTGTWPIRTEGSSRLRGQTSNALASSIVLVCRPRSTGAATTTRREFVAALKAELPAALAHLQRGNIAPVDLAQAAIGPGMAVYTRYEKVLDAEGNPLPVREALALINQTLDEALAEQEGDFDADTRWALAWFEQSGFAEGEYGAAETLSKAKNTSVQGLVDAGVLASKRGKVRLLTPEELPDGWDPAMDPRLNAWEVVHHLVRALAAGGEAAAAKLVAKLGAKAEIARELAYRLYTLCERKRRASEALGYNALVQSWPEIERLSKEGSTPSPARGLFDEET